MYRTTSLKQQFYERRGNWSIRPLHSLRDGMPTEATVSGQTLKEQYGELKAQLRKAEADAGDLWNQWMHQRITGADYQLRREELRKSRESLIQQVGNLRSIVEQSDQLQLERVFMAVAQIHLDKDTFLSFVNEARELWRDNGNGWLEPTVRQKHKRQRGQWKKREAGR